MFVEGLHLENTHTHTHIHIRERERWREHKNYLPTKIWRNGRNETKTKQTSRDGWIISKKGGIYRKWGDDEICIHLKSPSNKNNIFLSHLISSHSVLSFDTIFQMKYHFSMGGLFHSIQVEWDPILVLGVCFYCGLISFDQDISSYTNICVWCWVFVGVSRRVVKGELGRMGCANVNEWRRKDGWNGGYCVMDAAEWTGNVVVSLFFLYPNSNRRLQRPFYLFWLLLEENTLIPPPFRFVFLSKTRKSILLRPPTHHFLQRVLWEIVLCKHILPFSFFFLLSSFSLSVDRKKYFILWFPILPTRYVEPFFHFCIYICICMYIHVYNIHMSQMIFLELFYFFSFFFFFFFVNNHETTKNIIIIICCSFERG